VGIVRQILSASGLRPGLRRKQCNLGGNTPLRPGNLSAGMPRGASPSKTPTFTLTHLGLLQGNATAVFEPYQGALKPESSARKKDLRKLGEWIEAKRIAAEVKRQEATVAAQGEGPQSGPGRRNSVLLASNS
jgi:hypothetical protein